MRKIATTAYPYFAGALVAVLLSLGVISLFAEEVPSVLTTNVDPKGKRILEADTSQDDDIAPLFAAFASLRDFAAILPSLANPSVEYVRVSPGMRKEEIAALLERKLSWAPEERGAFLSAATKNEQLQEGVFYPGVYLLPKDADGESVGAYMAERFDAMVAGRYASSTKKVISLGTALKIASIIEREANGKRDMHLVSGVIWNRLFREMSLDMDATLQYAKGNEEIGWWPRVLPEDKFIESPYNTYQNEGLPPAPISNPSVATIEAALNPKKTEYLYYLHDRFGNFRGAKSYKEHLKNIDRYLK
ncbi:endolytic transglycosylase MltG [Candidatus Parcubacteria bacterium]|nr:endolytic transglycosylase MltG [Candidatus Parcubacteria bacterium]